jgi:thioredoxin 2
MQKSQVGSFMLKIAAGKSSSASMMKNMCSSIKIYRTHFEKGKGFEAMNQESVIVGCTHCGAKNRIPKNRLKDRATCGKCHHPLTLSARYPEDPVEVTDQSFNSEVLGFPGPVVVFFWQPWCGYCQRLMPDFNALAREYSGRIKFAKIHLDRNPISGGNYTVQSVPTLILMKRGRQVDRIVGALPKMELDRRLRVLL